MNVNKFPSHVFVFNNLTIFGSKYLYIFKILVELKERISIKSYSYEFDKNIICSIYRVNNITKSSSSSFFNLIFLKCWFRLLNHTLDFFNKHLNIIIIIYYHRCRVKETVIGYLMKDIIYPLFPLSIEGLPKRIASCCEVSRP